MTSRCSTDIRTARCRAASGQAGAHRGGGRGLAKAGVQKAGPRGRGCIRDAERETAERHAAWAKRLPDDPAQLWPFLHGLPEAELLALLAHCASQTVNALKVRGAPSEALAHADVLAREVGLDMTAYWQPSAANYLARVSKDRILEALREGGADGIDGIAKLKKPAMAEAAEKLLLGKGWLPVPFRLPQQAAA